MADFAHEVGGDVSYLIMADRWKSSMRATESVLEGEPFVAHAVRWSQRGWPAIAEAESVTEVTFV